MDREDERKRKIKGRKRERGRRERRGNRREEDIERGEEKEKQREKSKEGTREKEKWTIKENETNRILVRYITRIYCKEISRRRHLIRFNDEKGLSTVPLYPVL